ncbi:MAG: MmgE/PrpD family protein [Thermodesulfobacteriota bacterium]|nr:MmgE/PrpD family protein [Thermodesulfobacteriota bacterium]
MTAVTNSTARLCEWVCTTGYGDIKVEIRQEALTILYDTIGGMIASSTLPTCQPVVDMVKALGGNRECSIVGHPVKTTVTYAALANGTIGHGDEVDATGQQGTGHFAPVMVATAISVGQYAKVSGKELLRALTLGSEVSARINSVMAEVFDHPRRHFADCIGSIIGAAVLAGVLLKLNAMQMEHAIALAALQASGLKAVYYDPTHQSKSFQVGNACQGGVVAALLAKRGFHGPPGILTVEHGFFDAFTGYASLGNQVVNDLDKTYLMSQIAYKRFPVGGPDQTPLYIFLQILKQHRLTADDIDQVEVTLSRGAFLTVATLKHPSVHLPTILSLAAVFGELNFQHIHESKYYEDPRVEAFKERVKLLPEPGWSSPGSRLEVTVRVRTRSGEVLNQGLRYPLMSAEELQHKFRSLVGLRVNQEKVLDLENKLKNIEAIDNVEPLFSELEIE